jgi:hypothetical protein
MSAEAGMDAMAMNTAAASAINILDAGFLFLFFDSPNIMIYLLRFICE